MTDLPVVCTLSAAAQQQRRDEVLLRLKAHVQEIKALPDGYAFRLDAEDDRLNEAVQLIQLERHCCGFLRFRLTVEPQQGPLWLEITGQDGTVEFLDGVFDLSNG